MTFSSEWCTSLVVLDPGLGRDFLSIDAEMVIMSKVQEAFLSVGQLPVFPQ